VSYKTSLRNGTKLGRCVRKMKCMVPCREWQPYRLQPLRETSWCCGRVSNGDDKLKSSREAKRQLFDRRRTDVVCGTRSPDRRLMAATAGFSGRTDADWDEWWEERHGCLMFSKKNRQWRAKYSPIGVAQSSKAELSVVGLFSTDRPNTRKSLFQGGSKLFESYPNLRTNYAWTLFFFEKKTFCSKPREPANVLIGSLGSINLEFTHYQRKVCFLSNMLSSNNSFVYNLGSVFELRWLQSIKWHSCCRRNFI